MLPLSSGDEKLINSKEKNKRFRLSLSLAVSLLSVTTGYSSQKGDRLRSLCLRWIRKYNSGSEKRS